MPHWRTECCCCLSYSHGSRGHVDSPLMNHVELCLSLVSLVHPCRQQGKYPDLSSAARICSPSKTGDMIYLVEFYIADSSHLKALWGSRVRFGHPAFCLSAQFERTP